MATKDELYAKLSAVRKELDEIEEAEAAADNKHLIGKCFSYRNCYSCPDSEEDYWLLYTHVVRVEGSCVYANTFQTDKYGRITIEFDRITHIDSGHTEISKEVFLKAWYQTLTSISNGSM